MTRALAIAMVAMLAAACSIDARSDAFRCAEGACPTGRSCVSDWCVLDPDGPACPAECTTCEGDTCVIRCNTNNACRTGVSCPAGRPCRVECTGGSSCKGGVSCGNNDACTISCTGGSSCEGPLTCSSGACNITCSDSACLGGIDCSSACSCSASCGATGACTGPTQCPSGCTLGTKECTADGTCDHC